MVKSAMPDIRKLIITLDHLPPRELNPNSLRSSHWSVRHEATRIAKDEIGWLAKAQWHDDKPMMKARISYEFHLKDNRKRDLDNLLGACKAYQDGLIEAGVIFYDDAKHLEIGSIKATVTGNEKTIITVKEILETE
jgi:Holliday junction resolvase RusA-like endonuclease